MELESSAVDNSIAIVPEGRSNTHTGIRISRGSNHHSFGRKMATASASVDPYHQESDNSFICATSMVLPRPRIIASEEDCADFVAVESDSEKFVLVKEMVNVRDRLLLRSSMKDSCHSTTATSTLSASLSSKISYMLDDSAHRSMKRNRNVRFSHLEIRSYGITLGDSPTPRGPPISLGWSYDPSATETYAVDEYEQNRHRRRTKIELVMPPSHREYLIQDAGFSRHEMKVVMEEAQKVAKQRNKNIQASGNKKSLLGKANDTRVKIISKLTFRRSSD